MEEKFLQIDENKIRYLESGNSQKTLVLVHGLGASAERWEKVIPIFAKHYRVLVPDLIGFGYSDKPLVDYTPEYFSDFLSKFFSLTNTKNASVIGSSLGGQVCAEFTLSHPEKVEKLILTSPA
ncbi:MAG: alpha/beta hydrolase, partial [Nitrosopumilus sp.]|nr:alpha/beta hydrolase [Nitrosopumilus sp.]